MEIEIFGGGAPFWRLRDSVDVSVRVNSFLDERDRCLGMGGMEFECDFLGLIT